MPNFMRGDLFSMAGPGVVIVVTTNGIIKSNGDLVMGRGAAGELARLCPRAPHVLGTAIRLAHPKTGDFYLYGCVVVPNPDNPTRSWGAFQTKGHYRDPSTLEMVEYGVYRLDKLASQTKTQYHVNFPGIGLGGLKREDVLPRLARLPGNVTIWEF